MPTDALLRAILAGLLRQLGTWIGGLILGAVGLYLAKHGIPTNWIVPTCVVVVVAIGTSAYGFLYSVRDKYAVAGKIVAVAETVANDPTIGPKIVQAVNAERQGQKPTQTVVQLTKRAA